MIQRCLLMCVIAFGISVSCAAAASAWSGGEVSYSQTITDYSTYNAEMELAQSKTDIQFVGQDEQLHTASAQVTVGKSVRLAYVPLATSWMISLGDDTAYHHFGYSNQYYTPVLIAGTNKMVLPQRGGGSVGYLLTLSDDITKDVTPLLGLRGQIVRYDVLYDNTHAFLSYQDAQGTTQKSGVYGQVFSRNKRFGVFWVSWRDFVRVDFKTGEIRAFLQRSGTWYDGIHASRVSAITNDGRYVFMNDGMSVVDVQPTCGLVINPAVYNGWIDPAYLQCPERQLDPSAVTGYDAWHQMSYLAPNERSFSYWLAPFPYTTGGTQEPRKVTVTVGNNKHEGIDYLALGDSYSSGEGDIETNANGANFYLPMTDIDSDTCHVSSRSYPYLLREYWGIDEANMKSVACSGARVVFDYYRPLSGYLGQDNRLAGRQDIAAIQQNAAEGFIPGRVPQLEFVKKYQPAVVTLTGGGNDVGFADMLAYCAYGSGNADNFQEYVVEGFYGLATCSFAQSGSDAQKITNRAIADQYLYTTRLIQSIKQASPNTQIYVIGYPSFISEGTGVCGNSLELDSQERATIHYYLRSLNAELSKAAGSENVSFIDIEDSLKGGRLCEGSKYVTGAKDVLLSSGAARNSMFHPNAEGHKMIATAIENAIANGDVMDIAIPERPDFVSANMYEGAAMNAPVVQGVATSNGPLPLNVQPGQFAPNTNVTATLHSDTINLGTIKTLPNGSIATTILHGALPVGFHMLTLEGAGVDGRPLLLYQFLTIDKGADGVVAGVVSSVSQTAAVNQAVMAPGEQAVSRATQSAGVVTSTVSPIAGNSAMVAKTDPISAPQQAPSGFTLVDNRILLGLFAWLFIITTWPLIRRVYAKAKYKAQ